MIHEVWALDNTVYRKCPIALTADNTADENKVSRTCKCNKNGCCFVGVLLAILEVGGAIKPLEVEGGGETVQAGTVSAGYQNFLVCVEMFFAAIGLHLAFPYSTYEQCTLLSDGPEGARASTMQVNYRPLSRCSHLKFLPLISMLPNRGWKKKIVWFLFSK